MFFLPHSRLLSLLLFLIYSASSFATLFYPVTLEKQMEESDVIFQGEYVSQTSKKITGAIVTEFTFKVQRWASKQVREKSETITFYQPGGVVGMEGMSVEGVANFKPNESVQLILKKAPNGDLWLSGLALGKYNQIIEKEKTYWSSSIFPIHPELGKISTHRFDEVVTKHFPNGWQNTFPGVKVKAIEGEKIVYETNKKPQRKIASEAPKKTIPFTWLMVGMALCFILGMWLAKPNHENE